MEISIWGESKKFNEKKMKEKLELEDKDLKVIEKIPSNSNDLVVITVAKNTWEQIEAKTDKKILTSTNNKNIKRIKC